MAWEVEGTSEFAEWYASLESDEQDAINESIERLEESGPALGAATCRYRSVVPVCQHEGTAHPI